MQQYPLARSDQYRNISDMEVFEKNEVQAVYNYVSPSRTTGYYNFDVAMVSMNRKNLLEHKGLSFNQLFVTIPTCWDKVRFLYPSHCHLSR